MLLLQMLYAFQTDCGCYCSFHMHRPTINRSSSLQALQSHLDSSWPHTFLFSSFLHHLHTETQDLHRLALARAWPYLIGVFWTYFITSQAFCFCFFTFGTLLFVHADLAWQAKLLPPKLCFYRQPKVMKISKISFNPNWERKEKNGAALQVYEAVPSVDKKLNRFNPRATAIPTGK